MNYAWMNYGYEYMGIDYGKVDEIQSELATRLSEQLKQEEARMLGTIFLQDGPAPLPILHLRDVEILFNSVSSWIAVCAEDEKNSFVQQFKDAGYAIRIDPFMPAGFAWAQDITQMIHMDLTKGTAMVLDRKPDAKYFGMRDGDFQKSTPAQNAGRIGLVREMLGK